jgi:hypothetical protein
MERRHRAALVRELKMIKITLTDEEALALLRDLVLLLPDDDNQIEPSIAKLWNKLLPADARRGGLLIALPEGQEEAAQ